MSRYEGDVTQAPDDLDLPTPPMRRRVSSRTGEDISETQLADTLSDGAPRQRSGGARSDGARSGSGRSGTARSGSAIRSGSVASGSAGSGVTSGSHSSTSSIDGARFVPGTVVADRYRLSGLLGRGGMGEVYKAEDLKLGERVALKLLPDRLALDGAGLARFHREVRMARQIAHPNVCRVFDIGEADGMFFLTMEYIDGEDLASLLRRIGRLPLDKALDLARQILAGLAAVHEQGILHRDLKPANVMIDSRGRAKISDFGLSDLAEDGGGNESEVAGTPAYMAPELVEGRVMVESDLYAFGLILHEMLTGRRLFRKAGVIERIRQGDEIQLEVEGLDTEIAELIKRCLHLEPEERPSSALELLVVLTGGDPLAAALKAGETPSPEMVARTQRRGTLDRWKGLACVGLCAASLLAILLAAETTTVLGEAQLDKSPDVLADRAETLLQDLGVDLSEGDQAHGFQVDEPRLVERTQANSQRRTDSVEPGAAGPGVRGNRETALTARPAPLTFWYRHSPNHLVPQRRWANRPGPDDPRRAPGDVLVKFDPRGRLQTLIQTPEASLRGPTAEVPDWRSLFERAELDLETFAPRVPDRAPPVFADLHLAWQAPDPDAPSRSIRVDAAALGGRPVYFEVSGVDEQSSTPANNHASAGWWLAVNAFFLLLWIASGFKARDNLRQGRGDRTGAFRLFLVATLGSLVAWVFETHHVASVAELQMFFSRLASALMYGTLLWLLYIALEPTVRRRWPSRIISWSRLVGGDWRDPLVGRDLLFGMSLYLTGHALAEGLHWLLLTTELGGAPTTIQQLPDKISGFRQSLGAFIGIVSWLPVLTALGVLFLLVVLRRIMPRRYATLMVGAVLFILAWADPAVSLPAAVAYGVATAVAADRWGLLALVGVGIAVELVVFAPLTLDSEQWYASTTLLGVGLTAALILWSYRVAIADEYPAPIRRLG